MTKLSVIIPCYNESATILTVLERVRAQMVPGAKIEVIVVDDGSTDDCQEKLRAHPELYDHAILNETNRGKGAAVRDGLAAATGTHVLFQDADLEYSPEEYTALLRPVLEHDADLVFGSRLAASPCTRVAYFWHRVGNRLITLTFNVLNNTTFTDIYSCHLLVRRSLFDGIDLKVDGWAQQAEILGKIVHDGLRMYEVPISYFGRTFDEGKKIRWHHGIGVLAEIVRCRFFASRRR